MTLVGRRAARLRIDCDPGRGVARSGSTTDEGTYDVSVTS